MSAKLCFTLDSTQTQTQTLFLWTFSCVSPSPSSTFFFSFVGSVAARLPHPLWFSFIELLILECYIAVPQLSATGGNAVLAKNMFVNITPHSNCRCECPTGQELTARGAPKLVVTINITESVEKRLSLALEHRILSEGDTIVVAPGQGPSSQVQLTTEPGANFGTRRVRTAASPSLAIRATSSTALLRCQTLNGSQPRKLCPNAVL